MSALIAVSYGWLERAEFDPTDGITLHVLGRTVRIKGRNLNGEVRPQVRLFHGITRHRVPWVRQAKEHAAGTAGGNDTAIESIEW